MSKRSYNLHLKGYVGGWDFDSDYVDFVLNKNQESEVNVLIDSLGGSLATALSIVAAFRNHGNVHVHYVGMNASAATIASLGAKHVSIDSSAMYLVHKCSMEFFQWASANSDKLQNIIEQAEQMKADLDKMDSNVAQMYAAKCKRSAVDLLALMKKGGWLTAQEALEWGFVDEITDYEDDAAPVVTDLVAADMHAAGIPVPSGLTKAEPSQGVMNRFIEALTNLFKNNTNTRQMNQEQNTPKAEETTATTAPSATAAPTAEDLAQKDTIIAQRDATIAEKDNEIARLQAEIAELKKAPGDSTSHVVDDQQNKPSDEPSAAATRFFENVRKARELYNSIG